MANAERTVSKKATGKKPTRKKAASAKRTTKKADSKKMRSSGETEQRTTDKILLQNIDPDYRRRMIAETSYFIAERHGFIDNSPVDDWLEAEVLVDRLLESGEIEHGTSVLPSK